MNLPRPTVPSKNPQKILIILPRQLGDILLGSSLAFALREQFPNAHIAWLSHPMGRQLLTGHPALDKIHFHPLWKSKDWKSILRAPFGYARDALKHALAEIAFVRMMRSEEFDTVVDSICTPRTALLAWFTGAGLRSGIRTRWNRNWAYTWLCSGEKWFEQYAARARLDLLEPLLPAEKIQNPPQRWLNSWIPALPQFSDKVIHWLRQAELTDSKFIVLSPTHRRPLRRWPNAAYVELALKIVTEFGYEIVWIWGPGELEFVQNIHEQLKTRLIEAGQSPSRSHMPPLFNLPEAAELSKRSQMWIGNSNGLSHVAMAGGASTLQIHGPTTAAPWTHPDSSKHIAVQRNIGCVRCESNSCKIETHECLVKLSVDEVFAAAVALRTASLH
ncbi:MAG: glycosyltransferase family 9 protein [Betaproteobacteria bacterium]|nr:glycosyltransferase family 9 protein [Betaproteobacteria bacterium]